MKQQTNTHTLEYPPTAVMWDDAVPGEQKRQLITLTNTGGQPLTITRVGMTTDDDPTELMVSDAEFSVASGGVDSAMELGPQESHEVEVVFDRPAGDTVSHLGILAIESNAGSSPDAVFFTVSAPGMGQ